MIKPEFWEDDKIAELSPLCRLFYIALWNFADDDGYIENRPKWLKAKCLPYDSVDVSVLVAELEVAERIIISGNIIKIPNFTRHQKIDRPRKSELKSVFAQNPVAIKTPNKTLATNILNYFNLKKGSSYKSCAYLPNILARIDDFGYDALILVIDYKHHQNKLYNQSIADGETPDPNHFCPNNYFNPETLFRQCKFEKYFEEAKQYLKQGETDDK